MILRKFHDVESNEFGMIELCREKIKRGLRAISPLKCKKEPSKNQKRAPENCHRLQCKARSMLQI